jgi:UDP-glucose 4-epimerase
MVDKSKTMLITGVAGFIGSHLADRLLDLGHRVIGLDNFTRGTKANIKHLGSNSNFDFKEVNIADYDALYISLSDYLVTNNIDVVWHMAANSDIKAGVADPNIDFRDTFLTTFNILKLMEKYGIKKIAFASSSAIYGETKKLIHEDFGPLFPISNYGAMKLASEALISSFLEKCLTRAWIFRFPNIIGSRATHGVIYDLFKKLQVANDILPVLGNGSQSKPYLHVTDLIDAIIFIWQNTELKMNYYNIGQIGRTSTVDYIAKTVVLRSHTNAKIKYLGGEKGWVGDVPKFNYDITKLMELGWLPSLSSKQSVDLAVEEIAKELGF